MTTNSAQNRTMDIAVLYALRLPPATPEEVVDKESSRVIFVAGKGLPLSFGKRAPRRTLPVVNDVDLLDVHVDMWSLLR